MFSNTMLRALVVILLASSYECQKSTFFIRPSSSSHCPEEVNTSHCYDLPTFISESSLSMSTNITLLFLPGEHFLENDLNVRNTKEFRMLPYYDTVGSVSEMNVKITCTNSTRLVIQNVSLVNIHSMSFHFCAVDVDSSGALQLSSVYHSEITNSKWYESRSSAVYIEESNAIISDCVFMSGNCSRCSGGGIHVESSNVTFAENILAMENSVVKKGGGLFAYNSKIHFHDVLKIVNNVVGKLGGGMYVRNCSITSNKDSSWVIENNTASIGGGLYFSKMKAFIAGTVVIASNTASTSGGGSELLFSQCNFSDVTFYDNSCHLCTGGGMRARVGEIVLESTTFTGNFAQRGGALHSWRSNITVLSEAVFTNNIALDLEGGAIHASSGHFIFESNVLLINNSVLYGDGSYIGDTSMGGAIYFFRVTGEFQKNTNIIGNTASYIGGGISMYSSTIKFTGSTNFSGNSATKGGAIAVYKNSQCLFMSDAKFAGNKARYSGGAITVLSSTLTFLDVSVMQISTNIAGWAGGGISASDSLLKLRCYKISFDSNHAHSYGGAIALDHTVLGIKGFISIVANNSAQYGGAIHSVVSKLVLEGYHAFEYNTAYIGGGWSLSDGSYFHASSALHMEFESNIAFQYGGAIWVEDIPFYSCVSDEKYPIRRCFFQFNDLFGKNFRCIFKNNTGFLAGSNVYGGNVDDCAYFVDSERYKYNYQNMFSRWFLSVNASTHSSPVSSDPMHVCLCTQNSEPDCSISNHTINAFPGQQFPLMLVGVGQRNGTVPAVILSHTDSPSNGSDTAKQASSNCSVLYYTIASEKPLVKLMLYPKMSCHNITSHTLTVSIKTKPCPLGFILNNVTKSCTCDDTIKKLGIQCDINSQSFSHSHGVWIDSSSVNDTIIYHTHCPFDYCVQEVSNFTLNNTDYQCRYNRCGIICGSCKKGYSLTLGGSECKQCSHKYLLLFIPQAVAGVVLVFFLLTLKLTVSVGTINGLILFANIIETNSSIFIPSESTAVLRVFIAWLNLNLGITTCFFDGLDMYTKAWLQFVFSFYVFILIGIIIFLSQRSTLFTKLLGSDPVAVLATLILLAYTKLLRVVLAVMSFTYIDALDGSSIVVWLHDGNIRFLSGKHIPLFIFALLIMLLLIVPYTTILLCSPYLQRFSTYKVLSWIDNCRFKHFLHSYYAPLKDKYRSWIGLLLVLRLCLLIVFVSNSIGDPSINLFVIISTVVFLLCWRGLFGTLYTNWCLDVIELFFIMTLGVFSASTLYVLHSDGNQRALTDTVIGMTFIIFIGIVVYHSWKQLTDSTWWINKVKPKLLKYFNSRKSTVESSEIQRDTERCEEPVQVTTTFIELHEPLLDD